MGSVSRGLGDFCFKPRTQEPKLCKVTANPDVSTHRCSVGDWLLIACDGIFDVMSSEEVQNFVDARLSSASTCEEHSYRDIAGPSFCSAVATALLQHCLSLGGTDNLSALLVHLV